MHVGGADAELLAQGAGSFIAPFFGGITATAALPVLRSQACVALMSAPGVPSVWPDFFATRCLPPSAAAKPKR